MQDDEEDVLYNVDSILTNIQETINSIIEQINVQEKSTPVCSKLILRRLLVKLVTERTFKFSNRFFLKKWMVPLLVDHYLLLLVTFIWSKGKNFL